MFKGLVRWKEKFKRQENKWGHGILRETARAGPTLYKERQSLRKQAVIPLKIFKLLHFKIKFSDEKYHKWTRKENPREWSNLRVSFVSILFDVPLHTALGYTKPGLGCTWQWHSAVGTSSLEPTTQQLQAPAGTLPRQALKEVPQGASCLGLGAERLVITMCPKMSDSLLALCVILQMLCRERHVVK